MFRAAFLFLALTSYVLSLVFVEVCLYLTKGKKTLRKNVGKLGLSRMTEKLCCRVPLILFTGGAGDVKVSLQKILLTSVKLGIAASVICELCNFFHL